MHESGNYIKRNKAEEHDPCLKKHYALLYLYAPSLSSSSL